jgi:hypothetical protein
MKLLIFNNKHKLDIPHEIMYLDRQEIDQMGIIEAIIKIKKFSPDLIIEEEKNDGFSKYTDIYKEFPKVAKAWWLIDGHCNLIDHVVYAKQFNYVFCAQSWFLPIVGNEVLAQCFYLPLCHTQTKTEWEEMLKTEVKRDIQFSFVGNIRSIHVDRKRYVRHFIEVYGDKFIPVQADYEKSLEYLRRSKVTFNCSLNNDLNFRVWEALACGTPVLTDDLWEMDNIRGLREYLITYSKMIPNWKNIYIPWDVVNPFSLQNFMRDHTLTNRYVELVQMVETRSQKNYA